MPIQLCVTLLLLQWVVAECGPGCLKCKNDKCQICESWSGHILQDGVCVSRKLTNCEFQASSGSCVLCQSGFYLHGTTKQCTEVPKEKAISKCDRYGSDLSCTSCLSGNYMNNGNCEAVAAAIDSCSAYRTSTRCAVCEKKFVLSLDQTKCLNADDKIPNCSNYRMVNCESCNKGFVLNRNNYLNVIFGSNFDAPVDDSTIAGAVDQYSSNFDSVKYPLCSPGLIAKCTGYVNSTTCNECEQGHFVTGSGKCEANPVSIISGCQTYSSKTTCVECISGFHLFSSNACKQNALVRNCTLYSRTAPLTTCLACDATTFISSAVSCSARVLSANIPNCNSTHPYKDLCMTCNRDFTLTTDGLACLTAVSGCVVYKNSNRFDSKLICSKCSNNLYLDVDSGRCNSGESALCTRFNHASPECIECNSQSFIQNGKCSALNPVSGCDTYDKFTPSVCTKCNPNSALFVKRSLCYTPPEPVEGCEAYDSQATCLFCSDGFTWNDGQCTRIPPSLNCLRLNESGKCAKCQPTFTMLKGVCQQPYSFMTNDCFQTNVDGFIEPDSIVCLSCQPNRFFRNMKNRFVCLETDLLNPTNSAQLAQCAMAIESQSTPGVFECQRCKEGTVLSGGACLTNCPTGTALTIQSVVSAGNSLFRVGSSLVCNDPNQNTPAEPNCLVQTTRAENSTSNAIQTSCVLCKDDYVNVIGIASTFQFSVPLSMAMALSRSTVQQPVSYFPTVSCTLKSTLATNNLLITGCHYHLLQPTGSLVGCLSCKHGMQGLVETKNGGTFVASCQQMDTCSGDLSVSGLPAWLNAVLTCHVCKDTSQIPYLFVNAGTSFADNSLSLTMYDLSLAEGSWKTANRPSPTTDCFSPDSVSSYIDLKTVPANCGVGMINVGSSTKSTASSDKALNVDRTKLAALCVACKPGYTSSGVPKDTTGVPVPQMISSCLPIANCQSSEAFNYCTTCAVFYAFPYTSVSGVQYNSCVSFPQDNSCFAVNVENPLAYVCQYCKPGFSFNQDGVCEIMTPPNCSQNRGYMEVVAVPRVDIILSMLLFPFGIGCTLCQQGMLAVKRDTDGMVCLVSSYLSALNFGPNTLFVINCVQYGLASTGVWACVRCRNGFVVSSDGSKCHSDLKLQNCLQAVSVDKCKACLSSFILVSDQCEPPSITNCLKYEEGVGMNSQRCLQCNSGFYLNSNDCFPGSISNCDVYDQSHKNCISCKSGFQMITNAVPEPSCFPVPSVFNCASFHQTDFEAGILNCQQCRDPSAYYLTDNLPVTEQPTACLNFTTVPNCKSHHVLALPGYSTFKCTSCNDGFVLTDQECHPLTASIQNCKSPSTTTDGVCLACNDNFFLSSDSKSCQPFPVGINFCRTYTDRESCKECEVNFYLNRTTKSCVKVSDQFAVDNCRYYDSFQVCTACENTYVLGSDKKCQPINAQNCLTALNSTACATCNPQMRLQVQNGLLNCVAIPDQKCLEYTLSGPFLCTKCSNGFYPDDSGLCKPVSKTIPNCIVYTTSSTCGRCEPGYVNDNSVKCTLGTIYSNNFDPNCANSINNNTLSCQSCSGGHYFSNSECVSCEISGCFYCVPGAIPPVCLVCQTGHYMSGNQSCVSWSKAEENGSQLTVDSIRRLLALTMVVFLWRID